MKNSYNGLTTSDRFLTVHTTLHIGNSIRFLSVRVPLVDLLQQHVTEAMDTTVRRALIERWSEADICDPLF